MTTTRASPSHMTIAIVWRARPPTALSELNQASTLTYGYDVLDRRVSLSDHLGGSTGYAYDFEGRLTDLTSPWGGSGNKMLDQMILFIFA